MFRNFYFFILSGFFLCLLTPKAFAIDPLLVLPVSHVLDPERRIEDVYPNSPQEDMVEVATAHVVFADYGLILHDFPFLKGKSHGEIDQWLLKSGGAFISERQAAQETVNTKVVTTGRRRKAYRPPSYGRAAVYDVSENGFSALIDSNGDGVGPDRTPHLGSHGNGLGTLAEKIRDLNFENAFRASLIHSNSPIGSVGSYAVISLGFDVKYPDGGTLPAGKYLRQAHHRLLYDDGNIRSAWLPGDIKKPVLDHLSRYGFYTGWEANIQGVIKKGKVFIFDFGHWIAWKGYVPESQIMVDERLAPDFNSWGWDDSDGPRRDQDQWRTSQLDRPFQWARDTAFADRRGKGRESVIGHYNDMVVPYLKKLNVGIHPAVSSPGAECRSNVAF